mmetsp:Transcript_128201/g.304398  ORF Transcript_128201/g.304398 Transcript_128201/m.304398 type:complete len:326 (-) Transcript_128201:476-1453(-)
MLRTNGHHQGLDLHHVVELHAARILGRKRLNGLSEVRGAGEVSAEARWPGLATIELQLRQDSGLPQREHKVVGREVAAGDGLSVHLLIDHHVAEGARAGPADDLGEFLVQGHLGHRRLDPAIRGRRHLARQEVHAGLEEDVTADLLALPPPLAELILAAEDCPKRREVELRNDAQGAGGAGAGGSARRARVRQSQHRSCTHALTVQLLHHFQRRIILRGVEAPVRDLAQHLAQRRLQDLLRGLGHGAPAELQEIVRGQNHPKLAVHIARHAPVPLQSLHELLQRQRGVEGLKLQGLAPGRFQHLPDRHLGRTKQRRFGGRPVLLA